MMIAALLILAGIYAVAGLFLFSDKTSDKRTTAEETQNIGGAAAEIIDGNTSVQTEPQTEAQTGEAKHLREQLAQIKSMNLDNYTEESLKNLFDYIAAAEAVIAGKASQEKMDDVSAKLDEAIAALEYVQ